MKKAVLLILIGFLSYSCSKDECDNTCGVLLDSRSKYRPAAGRTRFYFKIKVSCTGEVFWFNNGDYTGDEALFVQKADSTTVYCFKNLYKLKIPGQE